MIFGRKRIYDLDAVAHTNDDASQTKMLVLQNPGSIDNSENVVAKKKCKLRGAAMDGVTLVVTCFFVRFLMLLSLPCICCQVMD